MPQSDMSGLPDTVPIAERKSRHELDYIVQTLKNFKLYHKRAAAGEEKMVFAILAFRRKRWLRNQHHQKAQRNAAAVFLRIGEMSLAT